MVDNPTDARASEKERNRWLLRRAMWLSVGAGFFMLGIKIAGYVLTGSTAILSDAAESVVHVVAVCFAAYSLRLSAKPADAGHLYGHAKISFFSAGFEGAMIIIAALYIIYTAVLKWLRGLELEHLGLGTLLTVLATLINGALGAYLVLLGRRKKSLILEANGRHVLTDCYTSLGVIVGLLLVLWTGWKPWDPICAIVVAANILLSGTRLIMTSVSGLMDVADPEVHKKIIEILDRETRRHGITYHDLLHRNLGDAQRVAVHLLFPGDTPIRQAHQIATQIEDEIEAAFDPPASVTTHLESVDDHAAAHERRPH